MGQLWPEPCSLVAASEFPRVERGPGGSREVRGSSGSRFSIFAFLAFIGPSGPIMADLGLSRPRHPPEEGIAAPHFSRDSSVARLGAVFRPFSREVRRILRFFDFRVKKFGFQGLDFLIRSFLIGLRLVIIIYYYHYYYYYYYIYIYIIILFCFCYNPRLILRSKLQTPKTGLRCCRRPPKLYR